VFQDLGGAEVAPAAAVPPSLPSEVPPPLDAVVIACAFADLDSPRTVTEVVAAFGGPLRSSAAKASYMRMCKSKNQEDFSICTNAIEPNAIGSPLFSFSSYFKPRYEKF
jgi:hypothetical protein